jgi:hypothetical protein
MTVINFVREKAKRELRRIINTSGSENVVSEATQSLIHLLESMERNDWEARRQNYQSSMTVLCEGDVG